MVEVDQALQDWFQYGRWFSYSSRNILTAMIRYWGHEHDYRNNLTCIRRGGIIPRQFPCNRKEVESLRDGPFSGFLASSGTSGEEGAPGKSSQMSKSDNKSSSDAKIEVVEGQEAQVKQIPEGTGPIAGQDAEGAEDLFEIHAATEEDELADAEDDDSGYMLVGEDDSSEPSQWESDVLCVADPFIRAKVEAFISRRR
jgi:hypothetical protein